MSNLVKTQFGFHIIKADERHAAGMRPFDDVKQAIRSQLGQALGDSTARRGAEAMRRKLARDPAASAAAKAAGDLRTSPPFAAGEPVADLGWVQGLAEDLALLPIDRWAPKIYRAGGAYLVVRPAKRVPETQAEFADVKRPAIEDMKTAKRREILEKRVAAIRSALAAGTTLDSVSAVYGGLKDAGFVARTTPTVSGLGAEPRVIDTAFAITPGRTTDTLATALGVAWIRVGEKRIVPGASFEKDAPALEQELVMKSYADWVDGRRKSMKIEILRADLRPEAMAAAAGVAPGRGAPAAVRNPASAAHTPRRKGGPSGNKVGP